MVDAMRAISRPLTNQSRCGRRSTLHLFRNIKVIYMRSAKKCSGFFSNETLLSAGRFLSARGAWYFLWVIGFGLVFALMLVPCSGVPVVVYTVNYMHLAAQRS